MTGPDHISYSSSDGIHTIRAQAWLPPGQPRGVLQIVHGVAEHIGRYDHVARFFNDSGLIVCGEDHLGHGRTARSGEFGFFASENGWDFLVQDIHALRLLAGARWPGVPYVMLGHSMGSFLTRTYLIRYPGTLDAAVLSGTGQEPAPRVAAGRFLAQLLCKLRGPKYVSDLAYRLSLGAYNQNFQPVRTPVDWLSRDTAMIDLHLRDPLCNFRPTVSMFRDMLGGIQFIGQPRNLARMDLDTPIYFFSGSRDPVGGMGQGVAHVAKLFDAAGCRDVTVKLYPDGRHEMLNEINRQEVMEELRVWLEERVLSK